MTRRDPPRQVAAHVAAATARPGLPPRPHPKPPLQARNGAAPPRPVADHVARAIQRTAAPPRPSTHLPPRPGVAVRPVAPHVRAMTARAAQAARKPEARPLAPHVAAAVRRHGAPQAAQPARSPAAIQRMEIEMADRWVVDTGLKIAIRDEGGFAAKASDLKSLGFKIWEGNFWTLAQTYPYLNLRKTLTGEFTLEEKREMEELHKIHRSGGGALKWTGGETKSVFFEGGESHGWAEEEAEYKKLLFVTGRDQVPRTGITEGWTYVGESAATARSNLGSLTVFDSNAPAFKWETLTASGTRLDPSVGPKLPACPPRKGGQRTLTWNDIKPFRGGTRATEGGKHTQAMNDVSATIAAAAAGYVDIKGIGDPFNPSETKKASYQWLHLFGYGLGGRDGKNPDEPDNLVVGTSMTNGFMELVESLIAEALFAGAMLSMSVEVDMIDTEYHIPGKISYTIWNAKNRWKAIRYDFEPMSTWPSYSGDKRFSREFFKESLGL